MNERDKYIQLGVDPSCLFEVKLPCGLYEGIVYQCEIKEKKEITKFELEVLQDAAAVFYMPIENIKTIDTTTYNEVTHVRYRYATLEKVYGKPPKFKIKKFEKYYNEE